MFNKNSLIRAIAVIGVITMMALVVLPGCSFIGKADVPEEQSTNDPFALDDTVNVGDTGLEQCCPICQSVNFKGPDEMGYFVCNDCGECFHVTCPHLAEMDSHFSEIHGFHADLSMTVFRGKCSDCARKETNL